MMYNTPVPPGFSTGLIPRNYATHPVGCYAFAPEFPDSELIDEAEWPERLAEMRATKSGLLDLREKYYDHLKSLDQDGLGLCVRPGTMIKTADGPRAIEDVRPGDAVLTAEGRSGVVTETMARLVREPLLTLYVGDAKLTLTGEHPVLTERGYLPAWTIKSGATVSLHRSWQPVKAVEVTPYAGPVFNLEVDGDHSYVAEGVGVHNCWAFSSTKATMYVRAMMNEPPVVLSAWYVAGKIKSWRDEGGWGAASLEFITQHGVPAMDKCPKYSRTYDTPEVAAAAELHKVTEWFDGSDNPAKAQKQLVSMLLKRIPCVVDLNDMSHSMCAIDIGNLNPLEIIFDNSWGEQGEHGLYRGRGARARPDGLVIPRVSIASAV